VMTASPILTPTPFSKSTGGAAAWLSRPYKGLK
jgi:hypothetical protein